MEHANSPVGYVVGTLMVVAFLYFLYGKYKAAQNKKRGGGERPEPGNSEEN